MKLLIIIIRDADSEQVIDALVKEEHIITRIASTGGFLRHGSVTLLIGVEEHQVEPLLELIKGLELSSKDEAHAATVFVLDMPEYLKV